MKKIDKLVLGSFIGPFILTFLVVVFILLMQHMLKYFDDIIGKDLGWDVLGQLLFYFAIFMTPVALPLAVLLSSLITFGNLGEHFELTAIKASGISLLRTLQPIFLFVLVLTVIAFYANNNLVPKAALEAYSLLYDIKQKKPALELREGAFYNGLPDISIKVNQKFPEDGDALKGVIVYDHRKNDGNKEVIIADSGRMSTILDERYLKFELFNGYNYSEGASRDREMTGKKRNAVSETLTRSKFAKTQIVFDLSSFQMSRTDKKWFQGNRIMRNISELDRDIDSLKDDILQQRLNYYNSSVGFFNFYEKKVTPELPTELKSFKIKRDSLERLKYVKSDPVLAQAPVEIKKDSSLIAIDSQKVNIDSLNKYKDTVKPKTSVENKLADPIIKRGNSKFTPKKKIGALNKSKQRIRIDSLRRLKARQKESVKEVEATKPKQPTKLPDSVMNAKIDSIFLAAMDLPAIQSATNTARQVKTQVESTNASIDTVEKELWVFEIQWHKILASSLACVAMFLIGAPLGAIIKKGGLGMPFLVSIFFFIIYYLLSMQGEKLAKQGTVSALTGVWAADVILFIIGLFFLRQARIDARLFESDFYSIAFDKFKRWFQSIRASKTNAVSKI